MAAKQRTTLKSIAEELGISVSVVSRVLSGQAPKYGISKTTAQAVLNIARKRNFRPNQLARALRLAKTHTLGLVIPDISNLFFAGLARSIEVAARKGGYSIVLCDTQEDEAVEREAVEILQSRMIDGLIISPVGKTCEHLTSIDKDGCPIVLVDRHFPGSEIPFVTSDNYGGAFKATRHLLENGHRAIGFIQGIPNSQSNVERLRGYTAALKEFGVRVNKSSIVGDQFSRRNGYVSAKVSLRTQPPPTALFLANNQIAFGALDALMEKDLAVPEDMSLVAFDDQPFFSHLATPLTTVQQKVAELGRHAMELLQALINGSGPLDVQGITVPTQLIIRESVRKIDTRKKKSASSN